LHGLEKKGYLRSMEQRSGKSRRKVYRATPLGRSAFRAAKSKVRELFGELIEGRR
jgi:DNA-binding PadR family transcriptional regulator